MSLALLRKEAREHGVVLAIMLVIGALALYALLHVGADLGGRFVGLARFLGSIAPLLALVIANRLLVREYMGRTQFFLETLPIGRARVFATKWLLGCVLMVLTTALAWYFAVRFAARTEVLASSAALGTLLCAATFSVAVWSFAALAGMLGRYRYLVWGAVAAAGLLAVDVAGVPFYELPVIRLLGQDVQMGIGLPERAAFVHALAIIVISTAGAAALALAGSGAMASALAQRMTARERVFGIVALIAVATVGYTLEPKPVQPPFDMAGGERYEGRHTRAAVLPTSSFDADAARALARMLATDADEFIDALGLTIHPPVFVLPQQGLDRHVMQRAALRAADGIVLRVAPNAPTESVRMLTMHSLLADATRDRGMKEDRHALLDGLAAYWALRDDAAVRERWWLRAAALPDPLPPDHLTAWAATSERFGECQSLALAFSTFAALVERRGVDTALQAVREILREPPDDARAVFERSPAAVLAASGIDWDWLASAAAEARASARERHAETLARRPSITASVEWRESPGQGTAIHTSLIGVPRYVAYYGVLLPWTADVGDLSRFDVLGSSAVLPLSPAKNARVLTVLEVDDEILDCPVRVLAERLTFDE